jgi:hypothetical protein
MLLPNSSCIARNGLNMRSIAAVASVGVRQRGERRLIDSLDGFGGVLDRAPTSLAASVTESPADSNAA